MRFKRLEKKKSSQDDVVLTANVLELDTTSGWVIVEYIQSLQIPGR